MLFDDVIQNVDQIWKKISSFYLKNGKNLIKKQNIH